MTRLICTSPPGGGVSRTVVVKMGGQSSPDTPIFHYGPAVVTALSIAEASLAGGRVAVKGRGFGNIDLGLAVTIGGRACTNVLRKSNEELECDFEPFSVAMRRTVGLDVAVTLMGQASAVGNALFSYAAGKVVGALTETLELPGA